MTSIAPQLNVCDITRQYDPPDGPLILSGISFDARGGDAIAIVGPSGSGKSTLLNIIGSLDKPTGGSVRLDDTVVTALDGDALAAYRARKVGFVFQDHHLLPQLTALENVLIPTLAAGRGADDLDRARQLLDAVGVLPRAEAFPAQLSGGERQRVAVARAMVNRPGILLCDEPTGNLDTDAAVRVVDLFLDLARQRGVILIMVTHNLELAGRLDRCLRLSRGRLVADQTPAAGGRP